MMRISDCHHHAQLLADYARGRLDDRDALRAEHVLAECDHCAAWWKQSFEGEQIGAMDEAVEQAWAGFAAPRQSRHHWWAAAAAATAVLGLGALYQSGRSIDTPPTTTASTVEVVDDSVISSLDFESGAVTAAKSDTSEPAAAISSMDFESGNLGGWTPST